MNEERSREIEELYHAARERAPEQREALLAQATAEVRGEVEALLVQDASGDKILDRPAREAAPSLLLTPGLQIGPYKIEAVLGEGGMGTVFRALDTKLNRPVAIKFLSNELADAAARRRFQREAQMASSLNAHESGEDKAAGTGKEESYGLCRPTRLCRISAPRIRL